MDSLKLNSPAKLNLNLSVLRKRIDGMHEIKTRFQLINLSDEVLIKKTSSKSISVKTNLAPSIENKKNIVFSAIKLLSDHIGKEIHCEVDIVKNTLWVEDWVVAVQMLLRYLLGLIFYLS